MSDPPSDFTPPRTTGGHWRWTPLSPEELEAQLPGYSVEKLLGQGGMGAVYKGLQTSLERPVAIKILPGGIDKEDPSYAERFRNEAKLMARLMHPAVVAVFDFGETPAGQLYFVMEYVDGTDIAKMIQQQGILTEAHALAITAHVCDALSAAHRLGIVHRDIKPANVLINLQGQVKVADFGLAKWEDPGQRGLTKTGYALGTPDYVAPEALLMGAEVDARADLYAAGVMLYQMLTGDLPRGAWKAPSERIPMLDPRFDAIVVKAMQSDPRDRYQSSEEMRRDLDVILSVPMAREGSPQSAALPQEAVAEMVDQRSAAPMKVRVRGKSAGRRPPARTEQVAAAKEKSGRGKVFAVASGIALALAGLGAWLALDRQAEGEPEASFVERSATAADPVSASALDGGGGPEEAPVRSEAGSPAPPPRELTAPAAPAVEVPEWLAEARQRGGRLRLAAWDASGTPLEGIEAGRTGEFDDFVEVGVSLTAWMARRANGETHGATFESSAWPRARLADPIEVTRFTRGNALMMLDAEGRLLADPTGQGRLREPSAATVVSVHGHVVFLDGEGSILRHVSTWPQAKPPPESFFHGFSAVTATQRDFIVVGSDQVMRAWNILSGELSEFPDAHFGAVELDATTSHVITRTPDGRVHVTDSRGGHPGDSRVPPSHLDPAVAVRAGSGAFAAQRADGRWTAWGENNAMVESVNNLGLAIDLDFLASSQFRFLLWIEPVEAAGLTQATAAPGETAPAAATPLEAPDPAPSATVAADPAGESSAGVDREIAARLIEVARAKGGTLRAWGFGPGNTPPELGEAAAFDDFVQVAVGQNGWAALRRNAEARLAAWGRSGSSYTGQPVFISPFNASFMLRGRSVTLREIPSGDFRNVYSGGSQTRSEWAHPDAVAILNPQNHITSLDSSGRILFSSAWSIGDGREQNPPEDFFLAASAFTVSANHYIAARPGLPVAAWNVQGGAHSDFPAEIRNVIAMDAASRHVVLLSESGTVHVRDPSGTPLPPDLAFLNPPADLPLAVAARAGENMVAAQLPGGEWLAWGQSPELVAQIGEIGVALDLDLYHDANATFAIWIEPSVEAASITRAADLPDDVARRFAEIEAQFQAAFDRDIAPGHEAAVADLDGKYSAAVQRALDAATQAGRLDEAVALREELRRGESGEPLPEAEGDSEPEALKALRSTYRETLAKLEAERDAKAKPLLDRLDQLLDAYQAELTREGRLDDALSVKARRDLGPPGTGGRAASEGGREPPPGETLAPSAASPASLPRWLEDATRSGGKLRVQGLWDGQPIDEREVLRNFRESDYAQVLAGDHGTFLGVRRRGSGKCFVMESDVAGIGSDRFREFQQIDGLERAAGMWISGGRLYRGGRAGVVELNLGKEALFGGLASGERIFRDRSGQWFATGHHFTNPEDPDIVPLMRSICQTIEEDQPSLFTMDGHRNIFWLSKEGQMKGLNVTLRPGRSTEIPIASQPTEPLLQILGTQGSPNLGKWVALGESGTVHAEQMGGFDQPVAELSPSLALRFWRYGGRDLLAARGPDGTWQAIGTEEPLIALIAAAGPAIDLDLYIKDEKNQFVVWIEPGSSLNQ